MVINVTKNRAVLFSLEKTVFEMLFDHTVARRKPKFIAALESGSVKHEDFINLTKLAEAPYPLFFLSVSEVKKIIKEYEKKVYFGVSKQQMSIASRGEVRLADISLVLKDITRKQSFLKKFIDVENRIPGTFKRDKLSIEQHAENLRKLLGYDLGDVEGISKEKSYELISTGLAKHNVFISLYAHHYTPQTITKDLQFSGIAINDKKCPFLFIKAGDNNSKIELWGRRLFTTALLLGCLCNGDCGPLTMDGKSGDLVEEEHYIFAEEFLMPAISFKENSIDSLQEAKSVSDKYSVSSSAAVMRAFRLKMINEATKDAYLKVLKSEWDKITSNNGGGRQLTPDKAINRYNNPAVVKIVLDKHQKGVITESTAKNLLCYKKGESFNLENL